MKTQITTKDFFNYLNKLGLFRLKLEENDQSFIGIVNVKPNLSDFTQTKDIGGGLFEVRLSKEDIFNHKITKGFF
jgi:hypothetical protein